MKTLNYYGDNTLEIFRDYYPDFDSLTEEQKDYINHITDFETIAYSVIDGKKIVLHDSLNGDVYVISSLKTFFSETIKYIAN